MLEVADNKTPAGCAAVFESPKQPVGAVGGALGFTQDFARPAVLAVEMELNLNKVSK